MKRFAVSALLLFSYVASSACATARPARAAAPAASPAYSSTYRPLASRPTVIRNASILTATGPIMTGAAVLMQDGKIVMVGTSVAAPPDALVIDATGKWITPGLIDTHSHLGVYPAPGVEAQADGNEATSPNTAQVWAEHSVWPQDPQFALALSGGITVLQVLPGSANLFGGRSVTLKNLPSLTVQGMKFPGAPYGLKMACGENPKRVYGERTTAPSTAMGNMAGFRQAWIRAAKYRADRDAPRGPGGGSPPDRDLQLETLAGVLAGEILVQTHCYRADEMALMIDLAAEFDYRIASFHHAVEAYKVRALLAEKAICASMWSDWWGFKLEAYDGIQANIPLVHEAGGCAIVHSDDGQVIQRLNQEAAKAMAAGQRAGIRVTPEDAIRWITINPARALGIEKLTGSLEPGKNADLVIWSSNPFSVYAKAEQVFIDGALVYDRRDSRYQPASDFMLGLLPNGGAR